MKVGVFILALLCSNVFAQRQYLDDIDCSTLKYGTLDASKTSKSHIRIIAKGKKLEGNQVIISQPFNLRKCILDSAKFDNNGTCLLSISIPAAMFLNITFSLNDRRSTGIRVFIQSDSSYTIKIDSVDSKYNFYHSYIFDGANKYINSHLNNYFREVADFTLNKKDHIGWGIGSEFIFGMNILEDSLQSSLARLLRRSSCSEYTKTLLVDNLAATILQRKYSILWINFEKIPYGKHEEYLTVKYGNPFNSELLNQNLSIKSLLNSYTAYKYIESIIAKHGHNRYLLDGDSTYEWREDYFIRRAELIKDLQLDISLREYLYAMHLITDSVKFEVIEKHLNQFKKLFPNSIYLHDLEEYLSMKN